MSINPNTVVLFGKRPDPVNFGVDGMLQPKGSTTPRLQLRAVVATFEALGSSDLRHFQNTFSTPGSEDTRSHERQTALSESVTDAKVSVIAGANYLVTRLTDKRNSLKVTGLISLIANIFKRQAYNAIIQSLQKTIANINQQLLPSIPNKVYCNKDDCIDLLNANGFQDLPDAAKNALATSLAESSPSIELETAGTLSTPEERQAFNKAILSHLEKNPAYQLANLKHKLSNYSYTYNTQLISLELVNQVLSSYDNSEKADGKETLKAFGIHNYLSDEEFSSFVDFINANNIYFEKSQSQTPTLLNKQAFALAVNTYLKMRNPKDPKRIAGENFDEFFRNSGKMFAKLFQETIKLDLSRTPLTEERAQKLLRTLGYGETPLTKSLAKFLIEKSFAFTHYSHLSHIETQIFNGLAILYLEGSLNESSDPSGLLRQLKETYRGKETPITRSELEDAYIFFTSKCVDDFSICPKTKMRERINLLLESIGMSRSMRDSELKSFQDLLIQHKLKIAANGMLGSENRRIFNSLFFAFLSSNFSATFATLNEQYPEAMSTERITTEICNAPLLWDKCKNTEAHNDASLSMILSEMKLPPAYNYEVFRYLKANDAFTVYNPKDLSLEEKTKLSNLLLGFINMKFPSANLALDGRSLSGPSFDLLYKGADLTTYYGVTTEGDGIASLPDFAAIAAEGDGEEE